MSHDFSLHPLPEELLKFAAEEINENPETRAVEIQTLRERILLHPRLMIRTDDAYLLRFLRSAAFNQEAAFTLIKKYFDVKADEKNKRLFTDLRPSAVKHVLEAGVTGELPERDKLGRRVMVFRPGRWDPSKYDIDDVFKANFMTLYKFVEDEETQIRGVVVIFDMNGMGFGHLTHISPMFAKRIAGLIQMILHGHDLGHLTLYFEKEHLPEDFGGKAPLYSNEKWMRTLLECDAEFDAESKNGLVKPTAKGGSGSFRKLDT